MYLDALSTMCKHANDFQFQGQSNKTEQDMVWKDRSQQELETLEVVAVRGSSCWAIFKNYIRCLAFGRVASRSTFMS